MTHLFALRGYFPHLGVFVFPCLSTCVNCHLFDQGTFIPKALTNKRLRKVSIEVHRIKSPGMKNNKNAGTHEECLVRFLQPATKEVKKAAKAEHREQKLHPTSAASLAASNGSQSNTAVHDDASVMDGAVPHEYSNLLHKDYFASPDFDKGWEDKYRFPLSCLSIKGTHKSGVFIKVQLGHSKHTRQLIFDTTEEAQAFCAVVEQELKLEKERGESKLRLAFGDKSMPTEPKEEITFLFEVVSAWNLPAGDLFSSDPYVLVSHNGKEVHRTKYIAKT